CRRLAAEAEGMVNMLPQMVEPVIPSPQLKHKLMARIDADLTAPHARLYLPVPPLSLSERLATLMRTWSPAIALASLVLVVAWWNWTLQNELQRTRAELFAIVNPTSHLALLSPGAAAPKDAQAKLYVTPSSSSALLVVAGLKPLGPDQTYEFWLMRGGQAKPEGIFNVDEHGNGRLLVQSTEPIGNFDQVGITIEKAGGAQIPTLSQLVFAGSIRQ
ncbi:MAG: hypothetical protein C4292_06095, partial [Nitrososphaera sp.]